MAAAMPLRDTPLTAQTSVCSEISKAKNGAKFFLYWNIQIPPAPPNRQKTKLSGLVFFRLFGGLKHRSPSVHERFVRRCKMI
jgi:hypothetical protein